MAHATIKSKDTGKVTRSKGRNWEKARAAEMGDGVMAKLLFD